MTKHKRERKQRKRQGQRRQRLPKKECSSEELTKEEDGRCANGKEEDAEAEAEAKEEEEVEVLVHWDSELEREFQSVHDWWSPPSRSTTTPLSPLQCVVC